MAETILPGVYIEVRPEGLIVPGQITVGNLGVVGTAARGELGVPVLLSSYPDAVQKFYQYDSFIDPSTGTRRTNELTLVRALELTFAHGATTVFAVRVAGRDANGKSIAKPATTTLKSAGGTAVTLEANSPGTWGEDLSVNVVPSPDPAVIVDEKHKGPAVTLDHKPVFKSARNRISVQFNNGVTSALNIIYDDAPGNPNAKAGEVKLTRSTGVMAFGDTVTGDDTVISTYLVDPALANPTDQPRVAKVTLSFEDAKEVFTAVDGQSLVDAINRDVSEGGSKWVKATKGDHPTEPPVRSTADDAFTAFKGGTNGEVGANYSEGLQALLNEDAHIIVAAGQDDSFGDELDAHCQLASTDTIKRDRIAVVGSKLGVSLDDLRGHNLASDRVIFVAPGIKATDAAASPVAEVTLPGGYAAAAVAGKIASFSPHISLTNKILSVGGLENNYNSAELTQLVQSRVLALEKRQGFRIVKGITTSTNSAFAQITTRRIVDYAKFGVRSAATPYIGLLNNDRVRGALRVTINSFLSEMVLDEMLVSYELSVTATRDDERKGIARVTMVLRPTFSIDFIKVTMFLE
jgi:hypothetical protein